MKTLLDLSPDLTVSAHSLAAIKRIDDEKCLVFLKGQGALDGFVVEREFDDLVSEWGEAIEEETDEG